MQANYRLRCASVHLVDKPVAIESARPADIPAAAGWTPGSSGLSAVKLNRQNANAPKNLPYRGKLHYFVAAPKTWRLGGSTFTVPECAIMTGIYAADCVRPAGAVWIK